MGGRPGNVRQLPGCCVELSPPRCDAHMSIVFLLIPLGIVLVAAAAVALIWAVDSGQYDGDVEENGRIALELDTTQKLD